MNSFKSFCSFTVGTQIAVHQFDNHVQALLRRERGVVLPISLIGLCWVLVGP